MRRGWTEEEIEYLTDNSSKKTISELALDLNRVRGSVRHKLSTLGLYYKRINRKCQVNRDFFKHWSNSMAYVFGYWCADGCIWSGNGHYNMNITSSDKYHLMKLRDILESNHKLHYRNDGSYKLEIGCKELYNDLINLGGCERKSLTIKFPSIPKSYIKDFILGYYDGDGGISHTTREPSIVFSGNKDFLEELQLNLPYLGKLKRSNKKSKAYDLRYNAEYAHDILEYLYNDAKIYLKRKYDVYLESKKWKRQRKLRVDSTLLTMNGYPRSYKLEK